LKVTELIFGGDDRFYNNIFYCPAYAKEKRDEDKKETVAEATGEEKQGGINFGLHAYCAYPLGGKAYQAAIEESERKIGIGMLTTFRSVKQPVYAEGNVYLLGAHALCGEENTAVYPDFDPQPLLEANDDVYLTLTVPQEMLALRTASVTTARLGSPRFPEALYENPDGTPITLDRDFFGKERGKNPTVGPFESLASGRFRMRLI